MQLKLDEAEKLYLMEIITVSVHFLFNLLNRIFVSCSFERQPNNLKPVNLVMKDQICLHFYHYECFQMC